MKTIFAIFDRKTCSCVLCKEASGLDDFERWFATVFLRGDGMMALYPQDYDIYSLIDFDDETMTVDHSVSSKLVCSVDELFDVFKLPRPTFAPSGE